MLLLDFNGLQGAQPGSGRQGAGERTPEAY